MPAWLNCQYSNSRNVEFLYSSNVYWWCGKPMFCCYDDNNNALLSSHLAQNLLCGSFMVTWNISWSPYWYQWLLWWWEAIIAMATETLNVFVVLSFYLIVSHYSLKHNQLTDTGAIVLATALQCNKSLEELKWVVNWVSYYQEKLALNEDHWPWALNNILLYSA